MIRECESFAQSRACPERLTGGKESNGDLLSAGSAGNASESRSLDCVAPFVTEWSHFARDDRVIREKKKARPSPSRSQSNNSYWTVTLTVVLCTRLDGPVPVTVTV